jgi:hypothetical protein
MKLLFAILAITVLPTVIGFVFFRERMLMTLDYQVSWILQLIGKEELYDEYKKIYNKKLRNNSS